MYVHVLAYRVFCGQCVHVHVYLYLSAIKCSLWRPIIIVTCCNITLMQQSYLDKEHRLEEQLNELQTNLAQLTAAKSMKRESIEDDKRSLTEIKQELGVIRKGGEELEEVERQLKQAVSRTHHMMVT